MLHLFIRNVIAVTFIVLMFQLSIVTCQNQFCKYTSNGFIYSVRCPYYCCDGVPTSPLEACCVSYTYSNSRSYWWISLVAIAIIAVTAGLISLLICCICVKGNHSFARAFYKPTVNQSLTQNPPYMISPNYRVGFSNYPTQQIASNYETGSLSDKPPSYDKIVFKNTKIETTNPIVEETHIPTVSLSVSK